MTMIVKLKSWRLAVGSWQRLPRPAYCQLPTANCQLRRAFTLTELLVVLGIIILIAIAAVPSFNYITGSRSIEAAQNAVAAALSRARQSAIYQGQPIGLAIWKDTTTGLYTLGLVQFDTTPSGTTNIDLSPDQDLTTLQPGVGAQGLVGEGGVTATYSAIDADLSAAGNQPTPAVIFFNANGQLVSLNYTIATMSNGSATIANQLYTHSGLTETSTPTPQSQIALILYDRRTYDAKTTDADRINYLNANGQFLVLNRYNGTILANQQ